VQTAILSTSIVILAIIAYGDVRTRRIPNVLTGAIGILGLTRIILLHEPIAAAYTLVAAAAIFGTAFLLFWCSALGGGDTKLVAAMALLIGHHNLLGFLFLMSLFGGALALAILAPGKIRHQPLILPRPVRIPSATQAGGDITAAAPSTVPYGVAIAAGGVITLILETSLLK
jgi:prepilin peptidase CpaA